MKRDLLLSCGFLILLAVLVGMVVFSPGAAEGITGTIIWDPTKIDLSLPAPSVVKAAIRFPSNASYTVKDINASTLLLEGSTPPDTTYLIPGSLVAEFDGEMVVSMLWARIYHMGTLAPPYKIYLTITGKLKDSAGGTAFSVTGDLKIIVHHSPEPI
jgi:hypothetical protein